MSLLTIRRLIRDQMGRYDLVNEDSSDNGANALINAACRFLDERSRFRHDSNRRHVRDITSGDFLVVIPELRAAERVEIMDSAGARAVLDRKEHLALRQEFGKEFGSGAPGRPVWWAQVAAKSPAPSQADLGLGGFQTEATGDTDDLLIEDCEDIFSSCQAILLNPRSDATYTVSIFGEFYSKKLIDDTDRNLWTQNYPETLLAATMMKAEIRKRNTEGTKDWLAAIDLDLEGMDREQARSELATARGHFKARK